MDTDLTRHQIFSNTRLDEEAGVTLVKKEYFGHYGEFDGKGYYVGPWWLWVDEKDAEQENAELRAMVDAAMSEMASVCDFREVEKTEEDTEKQAAESYEERFKFSPGSVFSCKKCGMTIEAPNISHLFNRGLCQFCQRKERSELVFDKPDSYHYNPYKGWNVFRKTLWKFDKIAWVNDFKGRLLSYKRRILTANTLYDLETNLISLKPAPAANLINLFGR